MVAIDTIHLFIGGNESGRPRRTQSALRPVQSLQTVALEFAEFAQCDPVAREPTGSERVCSESSDEVREVTVRLRGDQFRRSVVAASFETESNCDILVAGNGRVLFKILRVP